MCEVHVSVCSVVLGALVQMGAATLGMSVCPFQFKSIHQ